MLIESKSDKDLSYEVLLHIYDKGGVDLLTLPKLQSSSLFSGNTSGSNATVAKSDDLLGDSLDSLIDSGLIVRETVDYGTAYGLTLQGLYALQQRAEHQLCDALGMPSLSVDEVRIEAAIEEGSLKGQRLSYREAGDFLQRLKLNLWGRVGNSDEPFLIAQTNMFLADSEAALQFGAYTLEDILSTSPGAKRYVDAICNHDVDGEPAQHIYELTEMLGLEEAIGRHLAIIEEIRIAPALIGKRLGRRIARKLALRYGQGGGIVIMPVNAYGLSYDLVEGTDMYDVVTEIYTEIGLIPHPQNGRYLVGDLRKISGLS